MSRSLKDFLDGPWTSDEWELRSGSLQGDLDSFIGGDNITVSMTPFKAREAFMGLLNPIRDSVWDIRSRDPCPALRVFGRFAVKDVFIAFDWRERQDLEDKHSRKWRDEIQRCKAKWRQRFSAYEPIKGDDPNDYLSNNFDVE